MRKFFWSLSAIAFISFLVWFSMNSSPTLAVTNGGKITEDQYYSQIRKSSAGQQLFAQMVIDTVLEDEFKDEVTEKDVNNAFTLQRAQYGSNFANFLAANSHTEDSYRTQIKSNLLMRQAVLNDHQFSEEDLQKAFENYTPTVEAAFIPVNDEETAKAIVDQARGGADFAELAKQYSTDSTTSSKGGVVPAFDSNSNQITSDLMGAINNTDNGSIADPYQTDTGWLVIKVINKTPKSDNIKDYTKQLKIAIVDQFMNDSANQKSIQTTIGKILKNANIDIKEKDLKAAVAGYLK